MFHELDIEREHPSRVDETMMLSMSSSVALATKTADDPQKPHSVRRSSSVKVEPSDFSDSGTSARELQRFKSYEYFRAL